MSDLVAVRLTDNMIPCDSSALPSSPSPTSLDGSVIGPHDIWLAATCLAHDLTMLTANVRELNREDGLEVEIWSMD